MELLFLFCGVLAITSAQELDEGLLEPTILQIIERENEAVVFFDPGNSNRVDSHLIEFGPANAPGFVFSIITNNTQAQMQGLLVNGNAVQFKGQVTNLGRDNNNQEVVMGEPSDQFFFRSSSVLVNQIRNRLEDIFFDDFNQSPGDADERRWNVAFSVCSLETTANFAIDSQQKANLMIGARLPEGCDRESVTARARVPFDFTGRTGQIFFDLDGGVFPGNAIALEISKETLDIPNTGNARDLVRVVLDDSQLNIEQVDAIGNRNILTTVDLNGLVDAQGNNVIASVPNVRKPWIVSVSATQIAVSINGVDVATANLQNLGFEVASVSLTLENTLSAEGGVFFIIMHIDNFGFDGVEPVLQTLNFRNVEQKAFFRGLSTFNILLDETDDVNEIDNPAAIRVMMTVHNLVDQDSTSFSLNGRQIVPDGGIQLGQDIFDPVNLIFTIDDDDDLANDGNNVITVTPTGVGNIFVGNVHIELDFACDNDPDRNFLAPVSQGIFPSSSLPISFADAATLARPRLDFIDVNDNGKFIISGGNAIGDVRINVDSQNQFRQQGFANGLFNIQVVIDCIADEAQTVQLFGTVFELENFVVSVVVPGPGIREVLLRAQDVTGATSTMGEGKDLIYMPLLVNTATGDFEIANDPDDDLDLGFGAGGAVAPAALLCNNAQIFLNSAVIENSADTVGLVAPSVCAESTNSGSVGRIPVSSSSRVPARIALYTGDRVFFGGVGNWKEEAHDTREVEPVNAQCTLFKAANPEFTVSCDTPDDAKPAVPNATLPENGIESWIDRAKREPYTLVVDKTLDSGILSPGGPDGGNGGGKGKGGDGIGEVPEVPDGGTDNGGGGGDAGVDMDEENVSAGFSVRASWPLLIPLLLLLIV